MRQISALPHHDPSGLHWRPLARLAAWLDQQTDLADKTAADAGLIAAAPARWKRTYRHPLFDQLRTARAAGCCCVPMCRPDQVTSLPGCRNEVA